MGYLQSDNAESWRAQEVINSRLDLPSLAKCIIRVQTPYLGAHRPSAQLNVGFKIKSRSAAQNFAGRLRFEGMQNWFSQMTCR